MTRQLYCPACDASYPAEAGHLACPRRTADNEHPLERRLDVLPSAAAIRAAWDPSGRSYTMFAPFFCSRALLGSEAYASLLDEVEEALRRYEGRDFRPTPLTAAPALAQALGQRGELWLKDETGNITGSHKARHLMGALLHIEALRRRGNGERRPLAIYSCGNAALAASAIARAGGYKLTAFVPEDLDPAVERGLQERGARVAKQARVCTGEGDPCYLAFAQALAEGQLAFSCSGPDTWSNIEGGLTLGLELVMQLADHDAAVDHVVVQVGGGALARSLVQALREARDIGLLDRLPAIHAVQPQGGFPFVRAWLLFLDELSSRAGRPLGLRYDFAADPRANLARCVAFSRDRAEDIQALVRLARERFETPLVQDLLAEAARRSRDFMRAWDGDPPASAAHGILDDLTYDWNHLLAGLLESGGTAAALDEDAIVAGHGLVQRHAGIPASATGAAAAAGLPLLRELGAIREKDGVALPVTGCER